MQDDAREAMDKVGPLPKRPESTDMTSPKQEGVRDLIEVVVARASTPEADARLDTHGRAPSGGSSSSVAETVHQVRPRTLLRDTRCSRSSMRGGRSLFQHGQCPCC